MNNAHGSAVSNWEALARVQCELDTGRVWEFVQPETRRYYMERQATLTPPSFVSVPNGLGFGVLKQWQREVCAGIDGQATQEPSTWRQNALYLAACWEALAFQAAWQGWADVTKGCLLLSAATIQQAHRGREEA